MTCIRVAAPGDLPALLAIYAPYVRGSTFTFEYDVPTPVEFACRMEDIQQRYPWLVFERDGVILGYAYASPFNERSAYRWTADLSVYLDSSWRGRGIGRRLYECLMRLLVLQGVHSVYGIVTDPNPASYRFHRSMGFAEKGHFEQIGFKHGRWLGVHYMAKELAPATGEPKSFIPFPELPSAAVEAVLADFRED